jgi:hypothetical protein
VAQVAQVAQQTAVLLVLILSQDQSRLLAAGVEMAVMVDQALEVVKVVILD